LPFHLRRIGAAFRRRARYTAIAFTQTLCDAGTAPSIGTVGDALENALMESTIGLYETELIDAHPRTWNCAAEVERETAGWVHWFNSTRLHPLIGHGPPIEYEQNYRVNTATSTGEVAQTQPPTNPGRFNRRCTLQHGRLVSGTYRCGI